MTDSGILTDAEQTVLGYLVDIQTPLDQLSRMFDCSEEAMRREILQVSIPLPDRAEILHFYELQDNATDKEVETEGEEDSSQNGELIEGEGDAGGTEVESESGTEVESESDTEGGGGLYVQQSLVELEKNFSFRHGFAAGALCTFCLGGTLYYLVLLHSHL